MRRFLLHSIILLIAFFVFDKAAYFILSGYAKIQEDNRLELLLNGELQHDIIVLGSSRGASNIDAFQLEKHLQKTTYNLSYRGSDVRFQELIFRKYLEHHSAPEKVLLVVDNPYAILKESTLGMRYDRLYPLAHYNEVNSILIEKNQHSWVSSFLYFLRVHPNQLVFNKEKQKSKFPFNARGSQLLPDKSTSSNNLTFETTVNYSNKNIDPAKVNSFKEIQKLCLKNDIQLYFVFSPDYYQFNERFYNEFKTEFNSNANFIKYSIQNTEYKNASNFYDISHLNHRGTRIFTQEVAESLLKTN